jgi:hypothetical protein
MGTPLTRIVSSVAFFGSILLGCGGAVHVVGDDGDGGVSTPDSGFTGTPDSGKSPDSGPGDGGSLDSGDSAHPIACGTSTCDGATQYCFYTPGCIEEGDGGTNENWVCTPIPSACTGHADTCGCILDLLNGPGPGTSGDTVVPAAGVDCTVTNNCA